MKSLIQRFEDAVKANGYRTCSDATQQEYEAAKKALEAALTAAPASDTDDDAIIAWCGTNGAEWRRKDNRSPALMTTPREYRPVLQSPKA